MRAVRIAGLVVLVTLAGSWSPARAGWGVGIRIGGPYYYGGYYRPYYGGYYAPYPIAVAPTVVIGGPPVVVQQPPAVVQVPPAQLAPPTASVAAVPVSAENESPEVRQALARANDPSEAVRSDAALWLGRNKVRQAVPTLTGLLASDPSPRVRDASARALGLIASEQALTALQTAAQADDDREVRHSAQFAAEVIRGNLRAR